RLFDLLTPREFEVAQFLATGMLNKQVGAELGMSEKTVKVHRGRIMQKKGIASVAELVRLDQDAEIAPIPKDQRCDSPTPVRSAFGLGSVSRRPKPLHSRLRST